MARTNRRGEFPTTTTEELSNEPKHALHAAEPVARSLLVVSEDPALLVELKRVAAAETSYEIVVCRDLREAQQHLRSTDWYAIILDMTSVVEEAGSSEQLREWCAGPIARVPILIVLGPTGSFPLRLAVLLDAISSRVLTRPIRGERLAEYLLTLGGNATRPSRVGLFETRVLRGRTVRFETRVLDLFPVLEELELAAAHDVTVLIVGETGSGKTTLAQLVHELSPRVGERFMHLACGALPPSLIESELFGHVKGAFTGADRNKVGRFEAVGKGTLLLDEIDSLTLDQQAKLLRVIETGEFEPVGSNETQRLEARLIVASNVSLETLVSNQRFRMDLYYRLNVLRFQLPPLRDRARDVIPLALEFIEEVCRRCGVAIEGVHPDFLKAVKGYHWPGNIRELKNCMERAVILSRDVHLSPASLPPAVTQAPPLSGTTAPRDSTLDRGGPVRGASLNEKVASSEQTIIEDALRRHHNKRAPVARELGISRVTLYNKMRKYGLI